MINFFIRLSFHAIMTIKKSLFLFCCIFFSYFSQAQVLPKDWFLSDDATILTQGGKPVTGFYNEDKIPQINLIFQEATYWTILTSNYTSKKDLMATMIVDGVTYDSVGVRFKGQTSYGGGGGGGGGTTSQKKSFNISMDAFKKNPDKLKGYQTLNLNNSFQDPSFMREVFYCHSIRPYAHSGKSNFVHLYLNGQDWGLYQNTQQLNGEFLKERFLTNNGTSWRADVPPGTVGGGGGGQWGDGKAAINFLGEDTLLYQKNYTLNGSKTSKSWQNLVNVSKVLNQTPLAELETKLADYWILTELCGIWQVKLLSLMMIRMFIKVKWTIIFIKMPKPGVSFRWNTMAIAQ